MEQARDGDSIAAQGEVIRAYCRMRGMECIGVVVDEGVSGSVPIGERGGGRRLLGMVSRQGPGVAVVAYKLDRLFRSAVDCLAMVEMWNRGGVACHLTDMGGQAVDTSSAMGKFFITVMAAAAELERNQTRERVASTMAHKREMGEYTGGAVPYGYRLGADGKHIEVDRGERAMMVVARSLRDAGGSLRAVGRGLAELGWLPRGGGRWHAKVVAKLVESAGG